MSRKTILITGAAAGIGLAIARRFALGGYFVGAFDIDAAGVQALRDELGPSNCHAGTLDVRDRKAWDSAIQDCEAAAGQSLDVLVNNAGVLDSGPFQDTGIDSHQRMVDINVKGVINGCHAAFPHMQGRTDRCIINMASASAIYGQPALATYAATKFAVRGLTEGLNAEWAPHGIRVVDIWPIFVQTAMVDGMKAESIKRMGVKLSAEDVAEVAWRAAHAGPRSPRVHYPVGRDTHIMGMAVRLMPGWLSRRVVMHLAT